MARLANVTCDCFHVCAGRLYFCDILDDLQTREYSWQTNTLRAIFSDVRLGVLDVGAADVVLVFADITMTKIIGLTGGIGSGKTTAADQFAKLGIDIIDTDIISRELVQPGMPALQKIINHFGKNLLLKNGELDRQALGKIIFFNKTQKAWLENLLHPLIRTEAIKRAIAATSPYCIIVIPLLFENEQRPYPLNKIVAVDCPVEMQIERVEKRNNLNHDEVLAIIAQQVSREKRLKNADEIITNNSDEAALTEQVKKLHQKWVNLA